VSGAVHFRGVTIVITLVDLGEPLVEMVSSECGLEIPVALHVLRKIHKNYHLAGRLLVMAKGWRAMHLEGSLSQMACLLDSLHT